MGLQLTQCFLYYKGRCRTQEQAHDVAQGQEGLSNSWTNGHQD